MKAFPFFATHDVYGQYAGSGAVIAAVRVLQTCPSVRHTCGDSRILTGKSGHQIF